MLSMVFFLSHARVSGGETGTTPYTWASRKSTPRVVGRVSRYLQVTENKRYNINCYDHETVHDIFILKALKYHLL